MVTDISTKQSPVVDPPRRSSTIDMITESPVVETPRRSLLAIFKGFNNFNKFYRFQDFMITTCLDPVLGGLDSTIYTMS